jgi:hypothetical protein
MRWVWAPSSSSPGRAGSGRRRFQGERADLRAVSVADDQLVFGGERWECSGGALDVMASDGGIRLVVPLEP